ncbi:ISNCY family transposase [bacterium]|nr:ISNCY family transposase [bacterium]
MRKNIIPMSTKELKKLHLIKKADEKLMTQAQAADLLDITERQFRRIIQNYRLLEERGLVHQLRGKSSNRKFSDHFKKSIVYIYQKNFSGYKPTFFTEKLASDYNITLSKESVRCILAKNNLWTVRKKRLKHRTKQPRKLHRGELVQLDGSVHQWFDGTEGYCVLMLYIDDASSNVYARFYTYEGTIPAMDSFRRYIQRYGIPMAIYADLHSTYRNNNKKLSIEEQLAGVRADTQFSRALNQLSVNYIPAYSPQAKGRVERTFQTFQDRLVKKLHRLNVSSIKEANAFLDTCFLKDHNRRFAVAPANQTDLHRGALPVSTLNKFLCIQEKRSVAKDFTVRYENKILQLAVPTIAKQVMVHLFCNSSLAVFHKDKSLKFMDVTHKHLQPNNKNKKNLPFMPVIDPITLKEVPAQYTS